VLAVHDRIAGDQLQRVDLVLAASRHPAAGFVRRSLARQISGSEHGKLHRFGGEAVAEFAGDEGGDTWDWDDIQAVEEPDRKLSLGEHLGEPLAGASTFGHDGDPPTGPDPLHDVRHGRLRVASIGLGDPARDRAGLHAGGIHLLGEVDQLAILRAHFAP
jgi:hypothetical protein